MRLAGVVVSGHGVASGRGGSGRFPTGTIALQKPHFAARGLDLGWAHDATINVDVAPVRPLLVRPQTTLRGVRWLDGYPAEDFSFAPLTVDHAGDRYRGLLYHPHPETKPEHVQPPGVLEILAPYIPGIASGVALDLILEDGVIEDVRSD